VSPESEDDFQSRRMARRADTLIMYAEMAIYVVISAALVVGATALLVEAVISFPKDLDRGVVWAATHLLSVLLLVFVFVELLGAVRSTVRERRLVAEPFLLVGIIACIKEIVLVAGTQREIVPATAVFEDAMIEIVVLAGTVLVLSLATVLLRSKRESFEGPAPASIQT
jgi:uncharacterized membrane protein (DUF373 family)